MNGVFVQILYSTLNANNHIINITGSGLGILEIQAHFDNVQSIYFEGSVSGYQAAEINGVYLMKVGLLSQKNLKLCGKCNDGIQVVILVVSFKVFMLPHQILLFHYLVIQIVQRGYCWG